MKNRSDPDDDPEKVNGGAGSDGDDENKEGSGSEGGKGRIVVAEMGAGPHK